MGPVWSLRLVLTNKSHASLGGKVSLAEFAAFKEKKKESEFALSFVKHYTTFFSSSSFSFCYFFSLLNNYFPIL